MKLFLLLLLCCRIKEIENFFLYLREFFKEEIWFVFTTHTWISSDLFRIGLVLRKLYINNSFLELL